MKLLPVAILALGSAFTPLPLVAQNKPAPAPSIKWDAMDLGPFHTGCFKIKDHIVAKGIAIKVGAGEDRATMLFDPELMRMSASWTGGFLTFPRGRGGLEGQIAPNLGSGEKKGEMVLSTAYAPGWANGEIGNDPREKHQGHLPVEAAKWLGLYLNGDKVILRYTVGATTVLEVPGFERRGPAGVFTRTLLVGKSEQPLTVLVADVPGSVGAAEGAVARMVVKNANPADGDRASVFGLSNAPEGAKLAVGANGRVTLQLPALPAGALVQIASASGKAAELPNAADMQKPAAPLPNPAALIKGGAARWGEPIETAAKLGTGEESYVADEIALPDDNAFKSWLWPGGHDFFPDGTAALVNISGDVWLVAGLDEKLQHVRWKRFATGLFQPLGCKIVDGKIYVIGRDQITRLHDLNADGEADFYENFNNDCIVTDNYHEFALDLETDSKGNFYYAKGSPWTPMVTSPHQGCLIAVSKDGSKFEVFATGLRAPNGLGIGPRDEITVSDNEGHWNPADRLNLVKRGGFYGMVTAAHRELNFTAADGATFKANPSTAAARGQFKTEFWGKGTDPVPAEHDQPLCWIPKSIDNSAGAQVWAPAGPAWGPLGGRLLFMSYGKCTLFNVLAEMVDGQAQGGLHQLPLKFSSGIMRGRFSPKDGQLYLSGLNVWQSNAAKDGCFYRVRYTGKPATLPVELHAVRDGVQLVFSAPVDEKTATDPENFSVERWNYLWTGNYGSPDISVADPTKKGRDAVAIGKVTLSPDKRVITLALPDMAPVMQMKIRYKISDAQGRALNQEIHNTINRLPAKAGS